MKNKKKIFANIVKSFAETSLRGDANRTSCVILYQPKAPAALSRFKKQSK